MHLRHGWLWGPFPTVDVARKMFLGETGEVVLGMVRSGAITPGWEGCQHGVLCVSIFHIPEDTLRLFVGIPYHSKVPQAGWH